MNVLVVGGAGYIGGGVTDVLLREGIPCTVYDNLMYEHQYLKPGDFILGDVRDTEKLGALLPNYTHVVWLAAIVGDGACQVRPELTVAVNQESVRWLADNFDGRIIFISTCSVYGENDDEVDENSAVNPLSVYAETKAAAEEILKDKNSVSFRLGTVYGVSDTYSRLRMDLVVNYMTANAITKGELSIFGGTQWRPIIHVRDVAEAVVSALDKPVRGVYNLGTANYQIKDLGKEVAEITGCKIEYVDQKFQDRRNYHVSTKRAQKEGLLEFNPARTVSDGVKQIKDLVSSGRLKYTENDIYFNERHVANLNDEGKFT